MQVPHLGQLDQSKGFKLPGLGQLGDKQGMTGMMDMQQRQMYQMGQPGQPGVMSIRDYQGIQDMKGDFQGYPRGDQQTVMHSKFDVLKLYEQADFIKNKPLPIFKGCLDTGIEMDDLIQNSSKMSKP